MAAMTLPPLLPNSGILTQKVLESIPRDKAHDTWYKPVKRHSVRQSSVPGGVLSEKRNEIDTAKYRNSFLHNICVEMLKEGFHLAFRELFNLIQSENELDEDDNIDHAEVAIQDCPDKLVYVKDQLIAAEIAQRQGYADQIYEAQLALSKYFDKIGNFRLSQHFYTETFKTSKHIRGDGRRKEAVANYNLGKAAERDNDYSLAQQFYEVYHMLTEGRNWKDENGESLRKHARDCLTSVLITLSEKLSPDEESEVLAYLHKAYNLVKGSEADDVSNVGYLLGSKYDMYGNHEKAVHYLSEYLDLCTSHGDDMGMGKAYQALAYAHQRQGNMEEAAENLKMLLNVMEKCGDVDTLREACSDLGALYNYIGNYKQSSNYFKRSFDIAQDKNHFSEIESSRCEYGMAMAHGLFSGEVERITSNSKANTSKLLAWKSERVQTFSDDLETYSMYSDS